MTRFNFWHRWLIVLSIMLIVFGVISLFPALFNTEFSYVNSAFWESGSTPDIVKVFYNWIFGVYAAIGLSWAVFILFILVYPFKKKEKWAWYCLLTCFSIWFFIDTFVSLAFEFYINAINNCIFYALLLVPLLLTKKEFFSRKEPKYLAK